MALGQPHHGHTFDGINLCASFSYPCICFVYQNVQSLNSDHTILPQAFLFGQAGGAGGYGWGWMMSQRYQMYGHCI